MALVEGTQSVQQSKSTRNLCPCLVAFFEREVRAWRGEARLSTVFWFYGVFVSFVLIALYAASRYQGQVLREQVLLICFGLYTIWILVSIWRCSFAADLFWGLLARWLTVAWAANAALILFFLQVNLLNRYAGT